MYTSQESRLIALERRNMVATILRRRQHRAVRQQKFAQAPVAHPQLNA